MINNKFEEIELEIINSQITAEKTILDILKREEKLSNLQHKSNDLIEESKLFYKKSKKVKRTMWKKKCCIKMFIFFICFIFIFFILFLSCGFDFKQCY